MSQLKISATIITFNEAQKIAACIDSVSDLVEEVVVVDSGSTDDTIEIARSKGARVLRHPFEGYVQQKNFAAKQATHSIILSIDADEQISPELSDSIRQVRDTWAADAYMMNRRNNYCGQWIKYSGWYPDRQLRLYDRRQAQWAGGSVHERVQLNDTGKIELLKGDLLHYTIDSREQHLAQIERFSALAAADLYAKGIQASVFRIYVKPIGKFLYNFFVRRGFLDGAAGYQICKNSAWSRHLRYKKLAELWRTEDES